MRWRCSKAKERKSSSPCVWSAWSWVMSTASRRGTEAPSICSRKSGEVSITTRVTAWPASSAARSAACSISAEQRRRRLRGLDGSHKPQSPFARGTPPDEPLPSMVRRVTLLMAASRGQTMRRNYPSSASRIPSRSSPSPWRGRRRHRAESSARNACRDAASAPDTDNRSR